MPIQERSPEEFLTGADENRLNNMGKKIHSMVHIVNKVLQRGRVVTPTAPGSPYLDKSLCQWIHNIQKFRTRPLQKSIF